MRLAVRLSALCFSFVATGLPGSEIVVLDESNYGQLVPQGKEVDAIHGDYLLRNERIVAVVAAPKNHRDANLTVKNVGGSVIDLTTSQAQSDQLSCYYPGAGAYRFSERVDWPDHFEKPPKGSATIAVSGYRMTPAVESKQDGLHILVGYELRSGESRLRLTSTITNKSDSAAKIKLNDGIRVDGDFRTGLDEPSAAWWAHDVYWGQAYGVQPDAPKGTVLAIAPRSGRTPLRIAFPPIGQSSDAYTLEPGESVTWRRSLFPKADSLEVLAVAREDRSIKQLPFVLRVRDANGPISGAQVQVSLSEGGLIGIGMTNDQGKLESRLPPGAYALEITAQGHGSSKASTVLNQPDNNELDIELSSAGYVAGTITDGNGEAIPCKVQFVGLQGTPTPKFGPDSAVRGVGNLQYTPNGSFEIKLVPGKYRWLASYGPEHDTAEGELEVVAGKTALVTASLVRTVDTTGWLSSELHSHSSPSGDNTTSQRGRVLNLLAEHLEFCPCTEHQRIDVYDDHLAHFDAAHRMLTCPGIELTGRPLPLNHQNAFPLKHAPHKQGGGGPRIHPDPVAQIKRLAAWDNGAEKVVQSNHPNIAQMVGDRDLNGVADKGFEEMFGYMDVVEIHPPELIFQPLGRAGDDDNGVGSGGWEGRGNVITNWLQLLNLGYRVTGVVNTDAHYNNHGSGWLRNWVRSDTDNPTQAKVLDLVHEFEHGHVVVSNGPFLEVEARSSGQQGAVAIPGDDLTALNGKVSVKVNVRRPNWIEINRVQFFINGRPSKKHNYTARTHSEWFKEGSEVFQQDITLDLDADAHIVVAVCGEGRQLGAVYGERFGAVMPVAVANPIFVDIDGDKNGDGIAFEHNNDTLGVPLPRLEGAKPSHGHDHHNHRH